MFLAQQPPEKKRLSFARYTIPRGFLGLGMHPKNKKGEHATDTKIQWLGSSSDAMIDRVQSLRGPSSVKMVGVRR